LKNQSTRRKRQGEWAEVCFLARALHLGCHVSKPYGDSAPYDFLVDMRGTLKRVQVKSVAFKDGKNFHITAGHGLKKRAYHTGELDLIAAYIIPCDAWYIIPLAALGGVRAVWFAPHRPSRRKFECFREAWHLLGSEALKGRT